MGGEEEDGSLRHRKALVASATVRTGAASSSFFLWSSSNIAPRPALASGRTGACFATCQLRLDEKEEKRREEEEEEEEEG